MLSFVFIACIVLVAVSFVVAASKRKTPSSAGILWVKHGMAYRAIAVVTFATAVYFGAVNIASGAIVRGAILATTFLLLGVPLLLIGFFWKVGYGEGGIYWRNMWGVNRLVGWDEIRHVSFSVGMKQWLIHVSNGNKIRINEIAPGCSRLMFLLKERGIEFKT